MDVTEGEGASEDAREARSRELVRQIWLRNRTTTLERLSVIESAVAALAEGDLDPDRRATAVGEAHKLRGILGTYGFHEGSVLAEEAEGMLEGDSDAEGARSLSTRLGAYARTLEES